MEISRAIGLCLFSLAQLCGRPLMLSSLAAHLRDVSQFPHPSRLLTIISAVLFSGSVGPDDESS